MQLKMNKTEGSNLGEEYVYIMGGHEISIMILLEAFNLTSW